MNQAKKLILLWAAACVSIALQGAAASAATPHTWPQLFDARDPGAGDPYVHSTDSGKLAWGESYMLQAYVTMYKATLKTKYLQKAERNIDIVFATAQANGWQWTSTAYSRDQTTPYAYTVHDGMILTPIAEFVRIVESDQPNLVAFKPKADRYLKFMLRYFANKWDPQWTLLDDGRGFFVLPDWDTQYVGLHPGISLPYNQSEAFGQFLLKLSQITGNTAYRDKAVAIGRTLKSAISIQDGCCYIWDYAGELLDTDGSRYMPVSDTSHANVDIGFVVDLNRQGLVFDQSDLIQIAATFTTYIYDPSTMEVHQFMDGTGDLNVQGYGNNFTGWSLLTTANPVLAPDLVALFHNPAVKMGGSEYELAIANMALELAQFR